MRGSGQVPPAEVVVHASCVAVAGRGVLIQGASGSGKSALALDLLSRDALLVADDRTCLSRSGDKVLASAPLAILGMIEARGVGILQAKPAPQTPLALVIDLDHIERDRLPPERSADCLGLNYPLLHKVDSPHFPAAILQYLRAGLWTEI